MGRIVAVGFCCCFMMTCAMAQEASKPGIEHAFLQRFVGEWDCDINLEGVTTKGKSHFQMELNGLHLTERFESKFGGTDFHGRGTQSYCPLRKKYLSTWIDSMAASPISMEGHVSDDQRTLIEKGDGPGPTGLVKFQNVYHWQDDNTVEFKIFQDDPSGKREVMSIVYRRTPTSK